jgi:chromosome segregation ATPase
MAFLVDNEDDFRLLDSELRRKQNLKIDIFTMKNAIIPPRPYDSRLMTELGDRMGGALRYLSDATPAPQCMPALVMSYLCTFQAFHKAMYLTPGDRSSNANLAALPPDSFRSLCRNEDQFQVYVVEGGSVITSYHGQKSRYASSEAPSLQTGDVRAHLNFLGVASASDESENRDSLQQELQRVHAETSKLESTRSKLADTQQRIAHQYEAFRRDRTSIMTDLRAPAQFNQLIDNEKRKINDIQKQLSRGAEVEKASFQRQLEGHIDKYTKAIGDLQRRILALDKLVVESRVIHQSFRDLQARHNTVLQQLRSRLSDVETFERAKESAERDRDAAQENFDTYERRLEDLQEESGGEAAFEKVYQRCILELPEKTLAEIRARIAEVSGLLERSIDNPQLLSRYEAAKADLATESEALMQLDSSLRNAEESIQARSTAWLDTVTAIANKLNMLFSAYMKELQYDGAVSLVKKGMFDSYEMQMHVSYRDEDGLFALSGQRHSGGERAVATIMYLMALQALTSAPFRVVDEINQGI